MIDRIIVIGNLSFRTARECYELMDQTWLLQTKQAFERDLKRSIDTEQGVIFAGVRINIIDNILEEREEKFKAEQALSKEG